MTVEVAGSKTNIYNRDNFFDSCTILGSAIYTFPLPNYEIGNKTRVESVKHCEWVVKERIESV